MSLKEDYDKAYAQGRSDAADPNHGEIDDGKVLAALVTGGIAAGLFGVTNNSYNPPDDPALQDAYNRGWKDEQEQK